MLVFDRGYTDYEWFRRLTEEEVHFVTRLKDNAAYLVVERRSAEEKGILADEIIAMEKQAQADTETAPFLRRVRYWDETAQRELVFLTIIWSCGCHHRETIYDIPGVAKKGSFLDNAVGRIVLNGWQFSGLTSIGSGAPVNVSYSITGTAAALLNREITGSEDIGPRVVMTCNPNESMGDRNINAFINTSCFAPALKGSVGEDSGYNRLRGPGIDQWDMSLFKRLPVGRSESRYLQLRLEAFNAFNHVEWNTLNTAAQFNASEKIINLPTAEGGSGGRFGFGALNTVRANSQRILQIAAKFYF